MTQNSLPTSTITATIIYIVLIAGLFIPFIGIVALIVAYVSKGDNPVWLDENYRYQIRTFWIGALYLFLSFLLTFVVIGYITLAITYIWYIIRCAKGLKALGKEKAPANVSSWLI